MNREELNQIAAREAHCKPFGASVTLSVGERDELVAMSRDGMHAPALKHALKRIAAIEDKMFGGDWDEIEEARNIACDALAESLGSTVGEEEA